MTAMHPIKRTKTAREMAKEFHVHPRTVQRIAAEPRAEYLQRANVKRDEVISLRAQGIKIKDIANRLDIPQGTVGVILARAKKDGALTVNFTVTGTS